MPVLRVAMILVSLNRLPDKDTLGRRAWHTFRLDRARILICDLFVQSRTPLLWVRIAGPQTRQKHDRDTEDDRMSRPPDLTPAGAAEMITIGGDLTVRRLGFGAMRLASSTVWERPGAAETVRALLRRVVALGVNFIDTADIYGPEVSERALADSLFPYKKDLVIATKGGLAGPGRGQFQPDGRPDHLRLACEASLRRLKLTEIALYQLHTVDPQVPLEDSVGALRDLQTAGKIRHIGLSNVSATQLQRARAVAPIRSVQNRYSLLDRRSDRVLATCTQEGIAFLPWAPLARGQLGLSGSVVSLLAATRGVTPAQIALAWLLHRAPVMVPIPGTASMPHLEENVAAAGITLDPEELAQLEVISGSATQA